MKKPFYVEVMVTGYVNVTVPANSIEDVDEELATTKAMKELDADPSVLWNREYEVVQIEQGEHEPIIGED